MRKRQRRQESDNADRWVVSYADFVTLLFAFFTTMYALSHVDVGKLERFAGSMKSAFKATGSGDINTNIIEGIRPIPYDDYDLEKDVRAELEGFLATTGVTVTTNNRGVLISLGDSILFDSGTAMIKDEAQPLLLSVASLVRKTRNEIVIEGHTDTVPIQSAQYPSNWELSSARATSVLRYFLNDRTNNPSRFSAAGYGEYRPIAPNSTPVGRAKNMRVDFIFVSTKNGTH